MLRYLKVFVFCVIVGWAFRALWDLNHAFKWLKSGDFFFGVGYALILFGCGYYIRSTIKRKMFAKKWHYQLASIFCDLFFYTCVSNLCDELLFDPYVVQWQEWVAALGVLFVLYIRTLWNTLKNSFE